MPKLTHLSGVENYVRTRTARVPKDAAMWQPVVMKRESPGRIVPMHGEVRIGTLAGLLRQAEVAPEDFLTALRK